MSRKNKNAIQRLLTRWKAYWTYTYLLFKPEPYPTLLSRDIKRRYKMFTGLKPVDEELKELINRINPFTIKHYSFHLARLNFFEDRLHALRQLLYTTTWIVFIILIGRIYSAVSIFNEFTGFSTFVRWSFWDYATQYALVIIFLGVFKFLLAFIEWNVTFYRRLLLFIIVLLLGLVYLSLPETGYSIYVFGVVGILIITLLSIGLDTSISLGFERHIRRNAPEEIIVFNILLVLHRVDKGALSYFYDANFLATRLEFAALFFERHIYQRLKTSDEEANEWIKERTLQIASAIRDKKKWIFTPKPDTAEHLTRSLASFLAHFMHNEWDLLERLETPQKSPRENWIAKTLSVARNLVIGLLPISVLLALQYLQVVSEPFSDNIILVAILWAVVNLIWLDPAAKDKVSAVKDAASITSKT